MKKILMILSLLLPSVAIANPPIFTTNYNEGIELSQELNHDCIIIFGADWCSYCVKQKKEVWGKLNNFENLVVIQVDIDNRPDIAKKFDIKKLPTTIYMKNNKVFNTKIGYKNPQDFYSWIRLSKQTN
jgi:thioredoxin 1